MSVIGNLTRFNQQNINNNFNRDTLAYAYAMETFRVRSYIRGYHAYMDIWSPEVGDQLILRREPENVVDVNAVSVLTEMDHVVGHLPKLMARWVSKFLKRLTNHGKVVVAGKKVNRGGGYGLEIPCEYEFEGDNFSCNWLKDKMQYEKYDIID